MLEVPVVVLDPELPLPRYARPGDAGFDLVARERAELAPGGGRVLVPTGIAVALPDGLRRLRAAPQRAGPRARRHRAQLTGSGRRRLPR